MNGRGFLGNSSRQKTTNGNPSQPSAVSGLVNVPEPEPESASDWASPSVSVSGCSPSAEVSWFTRPPGSPGPDDPSAATVGSGISCAAASKPFPPEPPG